MALTAQQTALAHLTAVPGTPIVRGPTVAPTHPILTVTAQPSTTRAIPTSGSGTTVVPVSVTETPGLKPLAGGTTYTNPAKTYRITLPPDWTPPAPDLVTPGRIVSRAPKDAVTLTIEEGPTPDNWTRLAPVVIAGMLDASYRQEAPGSTLQNVALTGIRGANDAGAPTYDLTYLSGASSSPMTVERFVTLTFAGAITITATAAPAVASATHPTVEGIVGTLVPLKLDAPTPAALAPTTGNGAITRTPSGLGIVLPDGWATIAPPASPPGVEFVAQSADGEQRVRVVHTQIADGTKLTDFAATIADELKASSANYEVDAEGTNMIGGARAVRNLYRATIGGKEVVGQSVALVKGSNGYVVSVETPAASYDAQPDDAQALFDRIESSVTLP
ncbi:MAG: hypothetical protein M3Y58_10710 [Chloroflexota bacterium]|nr:hypothetical protein [Chloroflexota bacterium]